MCKNVFVDRHEQSDVVKDWKNFLQKIEELKPYIVEFEENNAIKPKVYLANYAVRGNNRRQVIIITHNEYIFPANNGI